MDGRTQSSSPLETILTKIKKREESLWGKMQSCSHQWLTRLEANPFLQNYGSLFKKPRDVTGLRSEPIDLDSLFLLSIFFHLLIFFLLTRIIFSPTLLDRAEPILVRILDLGERAQKGIERTQKAPKKITQPRPRPPASSATEKEKSTTPSPTPVPSLPAPKVLAEAPSGKVTGLIGEPVEALIQLPTRQSGGDQAPVPPKADPLPATVADEGVLLPERLRRGEGSQWADTGGSRRLSSLSSPDFGPYLEKIKKRVQSVWQYPEGISGRHQVYLSFILDRAGKLVRVKVLESTDSQLNSSALRAMKNASPFPPIPVSLQELAGEELGIRFRIDLGVKGAR